MNNLPSEILSDIFLKTLPPGACREFDWHYRSHNLAPVRISHVCYRWRELSLSIGDLWSHLSICFEGNSPSWFASFRSRRTMLEVFETWLRRTGNSPLNFTFWFLHLSAIDDHRACEDIIRALLSQQHRWRDVDFLWKDFWPSSGFPGVVATDMPLLSSLSFYLRTIDMEGGSRINLARSPRLQRLHVDGRGNILEVGDTPIHGLTGLCDIRFSGYGDNQPTGALHCRRFLEAVPNLRYFDADFEDSPATALESLDELRILTLRDLRTLKLTSERSSSFILNKLLLPQLVALSYAEHWDSTRGEVFLNFVQRSMPPLTVLDLNGVCANDNWLIPALRLLPSLESLFVERARISSQFFIALTLNCDAGPNGTDSGANKSNVCPVLSCLLLYRIVYTEETLVYMDAFIAMVESRREVWENMAITLESRILSIPLSREDHETLRNYDGDIRIMPKRGNAFHFPTWERYIQLR